MPFDPKIFRQDELWLEQCEPELPDDLALMGEQLRDDARRLAACYPSASAPGREMVGIATSARRRWAGRRPLATASTLAGAAALGLLVAVTVNPTVRDIPAQPEVVIDANAKAGSPNPQLASRRSPVVDQAELAPPADLLTPAVFSGATPAITPAVLGQGITSPEMEAWMDLRQNDLAMDAESIEF